MFPSSLANKWILEIEDYLITTGYMLANKILSGFINKFAGSTF